MKPELAANLNQPASKLYRENLAEQLKQELDKKRRREILDETKSTPEYKNSRESQVALRHEIAAEKNRRKELEREHEKTEYLKEIEILKFEFESKIAETNSLISQFFSGFSTDISEVDSPVSLKSVEAQIKELNQVKSDGRDYISRATQMLLQLRKLEDTIKNDIEFSNRSIKLLGERMAVIQDEISEIKQQGVINRLLSLPEISRRRRQIKTLKKQSVKEAKSITGQEQNFYTVAGYWHYDLEKKMCDSLFAQVNKTAKAEIGDALKKLWDKVNANTFFAEEMGSAYIDQFVKPAFDKVMAERRKIKEAYGYNPTINEKLRDTVCANLKKYLITNDRTTLDAIREAIHVLPSEINNACQPLLSEAINGNLYHIQEITSSLFIQYAIEKTSGGTENLQTERQKLSAKVKPEKLKNCMQREKMNDYYLRFPRFFDKLPYDIEWPISIGHFDRDILPHMPLWTAAKNQPLTRGAFGEEIETLDQKYYKIILKESLFDKNGKYIDNLCYYPTPDSIKTLTLLAAADFENYRTVHANWSLAELSNRHDWTSLLDEAEKKYPELKYARPILETWESPDHPTRNPKITEASVNLAESLIENEPNNVLQRKLAEQVLPDSRLFDILESRGYLSGQDINLLRQADLVLRDNDNAVSLIYQTRNCVINILQFHDAKLANATNSIAPLLAISKKIIENQKNPKYISFLVSSDLIESAKSFFNQKNKNLKPENLDLLLSAPKELPDLTEHWEMLKIFCEHFNGSETVEFYKQIYQSHRGKLDKNDYALISLARLVGDNKLTPERGLALLGTITTKRGEANFTAMDNVYRELAQSRPEIFLQTDDGLDFLNFLNQGNSLNALPPDLEAAMGAKLVGGYPQFRNEIALNIVDIEERQNVKPLFKSVKSPEVDKTNWQGLLLAFIDIAEGNYWQNYLSNDDAERIKIEFEKETSKNICSAEMKKLWLEYLKGGEVNAFPLSLIVINEHIKKSGGAGPLSQIESLSAFTDAYSLMLGNQRTVARTKQEVLNGLTAAESRFIKEHWSNEDISDFYNISRDVITAAPSLFSEYFNLFEKLKPKDFKQFSQELFPLHRVLLSLAEERDENDLTRFNKNNLVDLRRYIANVVGDSQEIKSLAAQKKELTDQILKMFKNKFGIIKLPDNLDKENIGKLSDISIYLANLSGRDEQKENILGYYLALILNNKWDNFRQGETINPKEYLTPEIALKLEAFLEKRAKLNPVTPENLSLAEKKMPKFLKILEEESENVAIGNIETVDVKLNNIITNLRHLEDLDLYPDAMDKQKMRLLLEYGNKNLGATAAKMYQSLAKIGKQPEFNGAESEIRKQIETCLLNNGAGINAENVKKHFQDEIRQLTVVVNLLNFVEDAGAEKEISELRDILKPTEEVIAVFNKLGEEFKPTSGAIAISQDLAYLDNLIVKNSGRLNDDETGRVKSYLSSIREKLVSLESIYDLIGKKLAKLKQGQTETKNILLKNKLDEISEIINQPDSQRIITSGLTNNLPFIIENIRECLACVRQGANNDTNLTFGDTNKFYLYSKSEIKAGSISDQLVFFEPMAYPDGEKEMSFVLDRIYGTNTPAILINQIGAVYKKYAKIKREFPEAKAAIFVTNAAINTGGLSAELLIDKLKESFGDKIRLDKVSGAKIEVVESAAADHYIEFGGEARDFGLREVDGITIRI